MIVQESPQELINRAFLQGETDLIGTKIFLSSTGSLAAIRSQYENAAFVKTDGIDFSANYVWDADFGLFNVGASGTYVNSYEYPGLGGAVIDGAGSRNRETFADPVPEFRAAANFGWMHEGHSMQMFVRHVSSFLDDQNSEFGTLSTGVPDFSNVIDEIRVGNHTTVDMSYSYNLGEVLGLSSATVTVGATNLFNARPPAVLGDGGYETRTHDPRGRLVYAGLRFGL